MNKLSWGSFFNNMGTFFRMVKTPRMEGLKSWLLNFYQYPTSLTMIGKPSVVFVSILVQWVSLVTLFLLSLILVPVCILFGYMPQTYVMFPKPKTVSAEKTVELSTTIPDEELDKLEAFAEQACEFVAESADFVAESAEKTMEEIKEGLDAIHEKYRDIIGQ